MAENKVVVYTNSTRGVLYPSGQHFWGGRSLTQNFRIGPRASLTTQVQVSDLGALKFATVYVDNDRELPTTRKFIAAFDIAVPKEDGPYGSRLPRNYWMILGPDETIKEVIVRHGYIIDAIGFVVADKTGKTSTKIFGGDGGTHTKISLKEDEYITEISGIFGEYQYFDDKTVVATIVIHTNLNPNGYGPYGMSDHVRNPLNFVSAATGPLAGFFGRHSQNLESVGIYTRIGATKEDGPYGSQLERNYSTILRHDESIIEVIVRHGFVVDALGFVVADRTGRTSTKIFGGAGGDQTKIPLESGEYITQISGIHGRYPTFNTVSAVATIRIHTNLNPTGYGPYGRAVQVENPRNFASAIGPIVGVFGRQSDRLESIGIYRSTIATSKAYAEIGGVGPTNWHLVEEKLSQSKSSDVSVDNNLGGKIEVNVSKNGDATIVFSVN